MAQKQLGVAPAGLTDAATVGSVLARPHGLLNRLINGDFRINQRAFASGTAMASGTYAHDRWRAGSGGCTYTFTQGAGSTPISITAGSLQQVVDPANIEGGSYTLSWTGTATARLYQGGTPGAYAVSPITVTGYAAATQTTVEFTNGTLGTAQLEPGPNATTFEQRFLGDEVALAQRYYWVSAAMGCIYSNAYGNKVTCYFTFPVQMRVAPTMVLVNGNVNGGSALQPFNAQFKVSSTDGGVLNQNGGRQDLNIGAAFSANGASGIIEAGTFGFDAEFH